MTAKQLYGSTAPDGSQYITLTDGNGNLVNADGPPNTYVATATDAGIRAAANAAIAAGGGTVLIPAGTITILSSLPVASNLSYVGFPPEPVSPSADAPDTNWTLNAGTILQGNGTFSCFTANTTPLSGPISFANAILNFHLENLGIDNFTYGIQIGSTYNPGPSFSSFKSLYFTRCAQWAVDITNFEHFTADIVKNINCANGQRYGADGNGGLGNSTFFDIFNSVDQTGTYNKLQSRGLVWEGATAITNPAINELLLERIQSNGGGRSMLSVSATFSNTSTSIGIPSGSSFVPGMAIAFTTTGNGFTAYQNYFVLSVIGNNITVGNSIYGTAIASTGNTTLTLTSWGQPLVELHGLSNFSGIQIEAESGGCIYVDGVSGALQISEVSNQGANYADIVVRNSNYCAMTQATGIVVDIDQISTPMFFSGKISNSIQGTSPSGVFEIAGNNILSISDFAGVTGDISGKYNGGPFLSSAYFIAPPSQGINFSGYTIPGQLAGYLSCLQSGATYTLQTITTSTLGSTNTGIQFNIDNWSGGNVTINTGGSQTFNAVSGFTSIIIPNGMGYAFTAMSGIPGFYWLATLLPKSNTVFTVSTLPTASAQWEGTTLYVTDAVAPVDLTTLTGSGTVFTSVICNGSTWVSTSTSNPYASPTFTGTVTTPLLKVTSAGSVTTPAIALTANETGTGFYVGSAGTLGLTVAGVDKFDFGISNTGGFTYNAFIAYTSNLLLASGSIFQWNSDTFLSRNSAAASLQFGAANAAVPVAQTLSFQSVASGTSNTAGQNATIIGSLSTGSGVSGDYIIKTGGTGAAATVQNSAVTGLTIKGATQAVLTTSARGDTGYGYVQPTTGGTVTLGAKVYHQIIDPTGALLTLTVQMTPSPFDGQMVDIRFSQAITTLTVSGNGNSVAGNPTSAALGSQFTGIYRAANTTWYF